MEAERDVEYFDYLAGLSDTQLHRVFEWLEMCFAQIKLLGKSKKGAAAPFLVVLRGFPRGEIEIPLWRFLFTASGFFFAVQRKRG